VHKRAIAGVVTFVAGSRLLDVSDQCPLLGVKQTSRKPSRMSAFDHSGSRGVWFAVMHNGSVQITAAVAPLAQDAF